ncbi:hypothetical protein LTR70_001679 [Exophiala xenobiotica]|uniref:Uncharacterized protein n=1 Tax=Lithohypha guttulata TaxID=1690604 RepID=A0ABR0KHG5_9EURO|nr:hypothetical protein LTR24_002571 [Lithohypha guttulata]KAK5327204.1 hypothetical protein LTR70_001679 [Exophiala xenobiotica]
MSCFRLVVVLFVSLPLSIFAAPLPAPSFPSTSDVEHTANWPAYGGNAKANPTPSSSSPTASKSTSDDNNSDTTTTNSNNTTQNDNDGNITTTLKNIDILNKSGNVIGNTVASNIANDNDILNDNVVAVASGNSLTTGDVNLDLLGDGLGLLGARDEA